MAWGSGNSQDPPLNSVEQRLWQGLESELIVDRGLRGAGGKFHLCIRSIRPVGGFPQSFLAYICALLASSDHS